MAEADSPQPSEQSRDPDVLARIGGWLFTRRTALPLPLAALILLVPAGTSPTLAVGVLIVAAGEGLRLWAVHNIGAISRTRTDRLGPLVTTGPFAFVRNPLYIGNVLIWSGFALAAQLVWMAPVVVVLLGLEYHAIVRWEERLLETRRGDEYRAYARSVPRWLPRFRAAERPGRGQPAAASSWRDTLFSERGTIVAIAAGFALLALKSRW